MCQAVVSVVGDSQRSEDTVPIKDTTTMAQSVWREMSEVAVVS